MCDIGTKALHRACELALTYSKKDFWRRFCTMEDGNMIIDIHKYHDLLLRIAARNGNKDAVEFFLQHGAVVHESWEKHLDSKMKRFIADILDAQPMDIKSATKLS